MKKVSLIITVLILCTNCKKNTTGGENSDQIQLSPKALISLSEATDQNCFNVQKYMMALYQLYPAPKIRTITSNVSLASNNPISSDFKTKTAFLNFIFRDSDRSSLFQVNSFTQQDCTSVLIKTSGEDFDEYKITDFNESSIHLRRESGEQYAFEWISPQHLKVTHGFSIGNEICNSDLNEYVNIERHYTWEPEMLNFDIFPDNIINNSYLQSLVEASGVEIDLLKPLSSIELKSLALQPIKKELLSCSNP